MKYLDLPREPKLLMGPGPCNVAPSVLEALARPLYGHLDPEFLVIMEQVKTMLRTVFDTKNKVTFPVSGTGSAGMEAALVNFLEPGDTAVVGVNGVFGTRLANLAERLGAKVARVEAPWGRRVPYEALAKAAETARPKIVAVVHGETSTGVRQDLTGLSDLAHSHESLLLVDCVTSLGGVPFHLDAWGVDIAYSGTQKCLACPPGLAPFSISDRALAVFKARRSPVPSFYLDLGELLKYLEGEGLKRAYHHTAPINMIYGLHQALRIILDEGLEARWQRHAEAAEYLIAKFAEFGLEPLVPPAERLASLTTFKIPVSLDEAKLRGALLEKHRIEIGAGLGPLAGKVLRIGLMGENASKATIDRLLNAMREEWAGAKK